VIAAEDKVSRRKTISRLIQARRVGTQEELRELLATEGYDVTQATLSRDLARLRARRVSLPEGGAYYELDPAGGFATTDHPLGRLQPMVDAVDFNDSMVVVRTKPGAASPVALALDGARLPDVLGTIAGDDTVFVAPRRTISPKKVCVELKSLMKLEGTR